MNKDTVSSFAKGALTGMLAGVALVSMGKMVMDNNKNLSKGSTKAMKAVGDFVEGIQTMFH